MARPVLILISGAPATGKTVLARRLAEALPVPVIERDAIKETLFDNLGVGDRAWSKKLGAASFALFYLTVETILTAGRSVIAEAAFHRPYSTRWLSRVRERFDVEILELHCHADSATALRRYLNRTGTADRHAGHDAGMSIEAQAREWRRQYPVYGPLTDGAELFMIDTTDFAAMEHQAIVARVRAALNLSAGC
ncbi:MAG: ATP-binding protein [Chloroflexi bacterium]|nr:ATP-binding protein [Chloroflexota bacterium]